MRTSQSNSPNEIVLHADKEHGGIQLAVLLIMLAATIVTFLLIDSLLLIPLLDGQSWDDYRPFLRLVLSIVIGLALGGAGENLLKRTWGSGRQICLSAGGLTVKEKGRQAEQIGWDKRMNVLRWHYPLRGYARGGRERRVPSSHSLFACRLLQDDCSVVIYSYLPPRQEEMMPGRAHFSQLDITELSSSNMLKRFSPPERPSISPALLSSKHGQFWTAEKARWTEGFELDPTDFAALLNELERYGVTSAV